ncbi:phospholipid-translocating P-type ATPase [Russula earlei]|uniref:Phospholipid-translocating P-type ATPase n=1 Tax=Russula earlei TaxID=71964 RepID=A0ACC0UA05_9AGAM|nr:phospholipid-translocating P-type ATPase [Russula earlei]
MPKRTGFIAWYDTLISSFSIEDLFVRKRPPGPSRTIFINQPLPDSYYDKNHRVLKAHQYNPNQVITSKYTLFTFLPRNLLEQYRRTANVFFTFIAILQFIPKFATISPALVLLPLVVVLGMTGSKDAYEDIKRHQSDRVVNFSEVRVLEGPGYVNHNAMAPKSKTFVRALTKRIGKRKLPKAEDKGVQALTIPAPPEAVDKSAPLRSSDVSDAEFDDDLAADPSGAGPPAHWKGTTWEDLRVGDFVKIVDHESIPADILICATSEDENVAFVETKNLDGETNLKSRHAVPALTHLRNAADCADPKNVFRIECDRPEVQMHKLAATVVINDERHPVDLQTTLLRGTVLRNTTWVIGIVMYTGLDTKLVLNAGGTPSKRGKVERQMNPMVLANLVLLGVMAVVCGVVDTILEHHYYPKQAPWLFRDNRSGDNPSINGLITLLFAFITFQNVVPISLYISIEFVRGCQAAFIYFDGDMYYRKTDSPALARTFTLSDDLGQIEYIFSDKTGTLTQNAMVFRRASVGGRVYVDEEPEPEETLPAVGKSPDPSTASADMRTSGSETGTPQETSNSPEADAVQLSGGVLRHFRSLQISREIEAAAADIRSPDRDRHGQYWTTLALCHTVLVGTDRRTGLLDYKAQSPDEAALVQAAADVGFEFRGRDRDVLILRTPFARDPLRFQLLNILEFTSVRKRMSVVVRQLGEGDRPGDYPILLLCKGADNVIFERLAPGGEELKAVTEEQLGGFANEGLRTLTLAHRVVPEDEYNSWVERYRIAIASLDDREGEIEQVSEEIERNLLLLGATAIEDKLQDGVPEAIADLKTAGIKVWVLTGDKLETAIAIGKSTNLIAREANIIIIRGGGEGASIYAQMLRAAEEYFPGSNITDDSEVNTESLGAHDEENAERRASQLFPLRRLSTGATSLVGSQNGERPGGYVLVIDGLALDDALKDESHKHLLLRLSMLCEAVVCCRVSPKQKALVVRLVRDGLDTMTLAIGDGANDVSMIQAADVGVGISGEEGLQAVNSSDYAIAQFRFLKRLLLVHGHWSYARNGNMINNFFYKNIICIGVLWWFMIYCAWSSAYVFEYTYLIFWNSFWTLCPVIAIGLFDRIVDDHVLMAIPQLYRYGREGKWFGSKLFTVFMLEGVVQSAIVFFILLYGYFSPSARNDGYDVGRLEFSTAMVISAAIVANLFNGLNTKVWTAWVFFAVFIGIVLIGAYTAIYSLIRPGRFFTPVYGNDHYLFQSAIFWFGILITALVALLPRYLYLAWSFGFNPNDLDILNWNYKIKPDLDLIHEAYRNTEENIEEQEARVPSPIPMTPHSARPGPFGRPSMQGSQIDMSTGVRSPSRGYSFAQEEYGVAMRRMQSNLSGAVPLDQGAERRSRGSNLLRTIRHPLRRK